MPTVRGCNLPDDLLYDVENNIWYRDNADGTVTLGMTAVAAAMAGQLVAFTPKKAGRSVEAGKSCATIESGKWVGPAKIAFDAEVVEVNEALTGDAQARQHRSLRRGLDGQGAPEGLGRRQAEPRSRHRGRRALRSEDDRRQFRRMRMKVKRMDRQ